MQEFIRAQWEKRGVWAWLLSPLSLLVCLLARIKRSAYQRGLLSQSQLPVPLIVVGNLNAGGSGKTPLVAWLADRLCEKGYRPGIICRGYRGTASHWPQSVSTDSDPGEVGDEAVLLANITGCPVAAGPDRHAAAQYLLAQSNCDLLLSDDGFQHQKLARDIDILVFDSSSGKPLGNGWCFPSGPLREPPSASQAADMLVYHGADDLPGQSYSMQLQAGQIYALPDRNRANPQQLGSAPLHAIAGIGRPQRFFDSLRELGLEIIEHAYDDHHPYRAEELRFDDRYDLITTEKDAIKLSDLQTEKTIWVLPVTAVLPDRFIEDLLTKLGSIDDTHD